MLRILIADDHPIVREGLKQVLASAPDLQVAGEALNGQEVLNLVGAQKFDVVVMDFSMPGRSGMDVLKDLHRDHPRVPVLILSMHPENELAPRVLKAGAAGYLAKESAPRELVQAVRKVASGGTYVSAALAETLAETLGNREFQHPHEGLSDREYEVMVLLASAHTPHEIADRLSLSVKTVRTYRDRILQKLNLKNDVELARYAIEHGLVGSSGQPG